MCGYKIIYADEIVFGEEHPHSYTAFRARNYKWAYGCIQVLREHGWNILLSRNLSSCEKWCLLSLISFYLVQSSFIIYMVISYILLPFFAKGLSPEIWQIFLTDILLITAIFSYTWAYFLKKRRLFDWFRFAIICAIVYGGTGLLSIKGTWDSLRGKRRDWIPTNTTHSSTAIHLKVLAEPLLAGLVFCVPYLSSRVLPISPLLYLESAKSKRKSEIERELPFYLAYASIVQRSGVSLLESMLRLRRYDVLALSLNQMEL